MMALPGREESIEREASQADPRTTRAKVLPGTEGSSNRPSAKTHLRSAVYDEEDEQRESAERFYDWPTPNKTVKYRPRRYSPPNSANCTHIGGLPPCGKRSYPPRTKLPLVVTRNGSFLLPLQNPAVPTGFFLQNWHKPILLTLSDQRGGVMTLTDARPAAKNED